MLFYEIIKLRDCLSKMIKNEKVSVEYFKAAGILGKYRGKFRAKEILKYFLTNNVSMLIIIYAKMGVVKKKITPFWA
jgi:hypothetical protein